MSSIIKTLGTKDALQQVAILKRQLSELRDQQAVIANEIFAKMHEEEEAAEEINPAPPINRRRREITPDRKTAEMMATRVEMEMEKGVLIYC